MLSNAKINLFLHVTGKYSNGYHELESLIVPINLHDKLDIELSNTAETYINISGEFAYLVSNCNNLINTTIETIFAYIGQKPDSFNINLEKNIPVGAGLGGGSSNCAITLHKINDIMSFGLTNDELKKIAIKIGADVPFFIDNKPCLIKNIGEVGNFVNLPDLNILLVFPHNGLSTARVFQHKSIEFEDEISVIESFENRDSLISFLTKCKNSLEENSISLLSDIQIITKQIYAQDGCLLSRMSGSGSCCFGIFDDRDSLEKAEINLKRESPYWWVKSLVSN